MTNASELLEGTTPGPWVCERNRPYTIQPDYPSFDSVATVQVANVECWKQNARLIAAAPDLARQVTQLEAQLAEVREAVEPLLCFHETGGQEGDGSDERLAAIRALLTQSKEPK